MGWRPSAASWFVRAGLLFLIVACADGSTAGAAASTLTLVLPRPPAPDEAVHLILKVGRLPRDARVVVRTDTGEIVGTIRPFGPSAREQGGTHVMAIPPEAVKDGKVSLVLQVEEKETGARVPTKEEVQSVTVALTPVTHQK